MREHDRHVREVDRDIVHVERVRILEPDPAASPLAHPDPALAGVEEGGQPRLGDRLVEDIGMPVVRIERLHARVELEPLDPVALDQGPRGARPGLPLPGIDARERDQHVGMRGSDLGDLLVRHGYLSRPGLAVDAEDDGCHLPLPVVRGDVLDGHRRVDVGLEHLRRLESLRLREGIFLPRHGDLRVGVNIDRDEVGDVHAASPGVVGT